MCWSEGATVTMVGVGAIATVITARRGEPLAIPFTLAFFTLMEALQVAGYEVIDQCGLTSNKTVTLLSYLHISLQPIVINAFAMAIAPTVVSQKMRRWIFGLSVLATTLILLRLVPFEWAGQCRPGDSLCGQTFCTISGTWHIGWQIPLNDMWGALNGSFRDFIPFPAYVFGVFALPLICGAWRFVVFHALFGPILSMLLTDNPNEMPAIWCLLSIALLVVSLSPGIRTRLLGSRVATA